MYPLARAPPHNLAVDFCLEVCRALPARHLPSRWLRDRAAPTEYKDSVSFRRTRGWFGSSSAQIGFHLPGPFLESEPFQTLPGSVPEGNCYRPSKGPVRPLATRLHHLTFLGLCLESRRCLLCGSWHERRNLEPSIIMVCMTTVGT